MTDFIQAVSDATKSLSSSPFIVSRNHSYTSLLKDERAHPSQADDTIFL